LFFCFSAANRTAPPAKAALALARRAAALAFALPEFTDDRAPAKALDVAATRLSRATFCFHCFRAFSGPNSRTNLLPSLVLQNSSNWAAKYLSPASASSSDLCGNQISGTPSLRLHDGVKVE
jgi:hypothetical protein